MQPPEGIGATPEDAKDLRIKELEAALAARERLEAAARRMREAHRGWANAETAKEVEGWLDLRQLAILELVAAVDALPGGSE